MKMHADNKTVKALVPGAVFGWLSVVKEYSVNNHHHRLFLFKCACGTEKIIIGSDVLRGKAKSCGCLNKAKTVERNIEIGAKKRLDAIINPASSERALYLAYRQQAVRRNIEFKLSLAEFSTFIYNPCCYCGKAPDNLFKPRTKKVFLYPIVYSGIDRQERFTGYTKTNCVSCCKVCNLAKHTMSTEEFKRWILQVYHHWAAKA
jgi:hypothetical protein